MHCPGGDPAHAQHAEMSNLSILPWPISLLQTRACRARRASAVNPPSRPRRSRGPDAPSGQAGRRASGTRHPHASSRSGAANGARGHAERQDPAVEGSGILDRRRGAVAFRAGAEERWCTLCVRRTMNPDIVLPRIVARADRTNPDAEPLRHPDCKSPSSRVQSTRSGRPPVIFRLSARPGGDRRAAALPGREDRRS